MVPNAGTTVRGQSVDFASISFICSSSYGS